MNTFDWLPVFAQEAAPKVKSFFEGMLIYPKPFLLDYKEWRKNVNYVGQEFVDFVSFKITSNCLFENCSSMIYIYKQEVKFWLI